MRMCYFIIKSFELVIFFKVVRDGYELRTRAQPKAGWLWASLRLLPYVLDMIGWNVVERERNLDHTDNVDEASHGVR